MITGAIVTIRPAAQASGPGVGLIAGPAGKSAYQVWLDAGNTGPIGAYLASLIGPPGATGPASTVPGPTGPASTVPGPANNLTIGTVVTGAAGSSAAASVAGTPPAQTLNLTIPRGDAGATGPANALAIGTVSTGAAGSSAAATITGSAPNQTLGLTIPRGDTGAAGSNGTNGTNGAAGADGRSLLNGTGAPASGAGNNGDFYLDTAASRLYGPKTSGAWGGYVSLIGPAGTNGTNGTNGAAWYAGSGAPGTVSGAVNGDWYLNTANGDLYRMASGAWSLQMNLTATSGTVHYDTSQSLSASQQQQALANLGLALHAIGQGRLVYSSASALLLKPYQGNQLWVNGAFRTIPSAGVSLANTGLSAGTLYYVYAYWTGSALALETSTTGHAPDATYGHEVKSGDATRTLVGMVYTGTGTPGTFVDSATQRYVASWFNRRTRRLDTGQQTPSTASASTVELTTALRTGFVTWGDESVALAVSGSTRVNASGFQSYTSIGIDGTPASVVSMWTAYSSSLYWAACAPQLRTEPAEGFHYGSVHGSVDSGQTAFWQIALVGEVRQ